MKKNNYEIRQVEAWEYPDGWVYNQSWHVCNVKTNAENLSKVFYNTLKKNGITFKRWKTLCNNECEILEIIDRKSKEPLFCMVPMD